MRTRALAGLLAAAVLATAGAAQGDGREDGATAGATAGQAAEHVIATLGGPHPETLGEVVSQFPRDPWLVVDELIGRGRRDAALALARATAGDDARSLQTWIASATADPADAATRRPLAAADVTIIEAGAAPSALARHAATLRELPLPDDGALALHLLSSRANLAELLHQAAEELQLAQAAAERAEAMGALAFATHAWGRAAGVARRLSDFKLALQQVQRMEQAARRHPEPSLRVHALLTLGDLHVDAGDAASAAAAAEGALALTSEGPAAGSRANALALRARAHLLAREIDAAEAALRMALEVLRRDEQSGLRPILHELLAQAAETRGDLAAVRGQRQLAAAAAADAGDPRTQTRQLREVARLSLSLGEEQEAHRALAAAREAAARAGDEYEVLELEVHWCDTLMFAGRFDEAGAGFLVASQAHERAARLQDAARTLNAYALCASSQGRIEEGIAALAAARMRWESRGDLQALVTLDLYLAERYEVAADATSLRRHAQRALEGARALGHRRAQADALASLAQADYLGGETVKAIEGHARQAVDILEALAQHALAADVLIETAFELSVRGNAARALALLEEVQQRCTVLKNRSGVALALAHASHIHLMLGDLDRCEALAKRAILTGMGASTDAGAAIAGADLAAVYVMRGTPEKAVTLLQGGIKLLERTPGARGLLAAVHNFLAFAQLSAGQPEQALASQLRSDSLYVGETAVPPPQGPLTRAVALHRLGRTEEALRALDEALATAVKLGDSWSVVGVHTGRTAAYLMRGNDEAARAAAEEAMASMPSMVAGLDTQTSSFARSVFSEVYVMGVEAARRLGSPEAAVHLAEAGRAGALLEAYGGRGSLDALLLAPAERERQAEIQRRIAQAEMRLRRARAEGASSADLAERKAAHVVLQEEFATRIALVQREAKAASRLAAPKPATLEALQRTLRAGEALVLYVAGAPLSEGLLGLEDLPCTAVIVEPDDARLATLPTRGEIERLADALTPRLTYVDPADAVLALRRAVIEPLALGAHVKRVLVSPHGDLHTVPFALLLPEFEVAYVPSGTLLVALRAERAPRGIGVLALGRPDYSSHGAQPVADGSPSRAGLTDLPETEAEAKAVGDRVLLRGEATEEGLRTALAERPRWRAVHFACHGLLDAARPALSALALTPSAANDGFLTAIETLTIPWSADLAALSGCETGRGKVFAGEGTVGLTHSFLATGVPRVLASQWKVSDAATSALMTHFYALWNPKDGSPGLDPAAALKTAQAHVRANPRWAHPYYWAAWSLWGLPERD